MYRMVIPSKNNKTHVMTFVSLVRVWFLLCLFTQTVLWVFFAVSRLFWKLVISLPESDESSADEDNQRCDWLKAKLSKGAVPTDPTMAGKVKLIIFIYYSDFIISH